ncbi:MAG: TIGR02757 family protein [Myxococcales bacterium]
MLAPRRAPRIKALLDELRAAHDPRERVPYDPVELVHLYRAPEDIEVAGLLCASLAYGRVDLFKPVLRRLLQALGPSPARFCRQMPARASWSAFEGLVYRFNQGADLACLLWACGEALRRHGSLGALFKRGLREGDGSLRDGLARFGGWLRAVDFAPVVRRLGAPRALDHLLPAPSAGGACKRLNLYLRWMIRGPDEVDFGVWKLPPSLLVIPLDTHIARMAHNLGLTRRRDLSWRTAEEITASLRLLDPADPVKYDFALCHYGMSGLCPPARRAARCAACALRGGCGPGGRLVRLHGGVTAEPAVA